jgi:hypothetical protein
MTGYTVLMVLCVILNLTPTCSRHPPKLELSVILCYPNYTVAKTHFLVARKQQ